jgi:hypothetical protein
MKLTKALAFYTLLLVALLAAACDWEPLPADTDVFYTKLRGTWESNDPSVYSGILTIDNKSITISGYSESQTPFPGGDDNRRPFKDFTRGVPLKGYSEEEEDTTQTNMIQGYIVIRDGGVLQDPIPYTFWEDPYQYGQTQNQFLRFNFGDRQETLVKTAQ